MHPCPGMYDSLRYVHMLRYPLHSTDTHADTHRDTYTPHTRTLMHANNTQAQQTYVPEKAKFAPRSREHYDFLCPLPDP